MIELILWCALCSQFAKSLPAVAGESPRGAPSVTGRGPSLAPNLPEMPQAKEIPAGEFPRKECGETTSCESGEPRPDVFRPDRRIWLSGAIALGAATAADQWTTRRNLDRGGVEFNPLYGSRPSIGRQAGTAAAIFAGELVIFRLTEKSHDAGVRWLGRGFAALVIAGETTAAACNASITIGHGSRERCTTF